MLETTQDWIKLTVAILGLYHVTRIYREAKRNHPPLHYAEHSAPPQDAWRWGLPDGKIGLRLEDDAHSSRLHLPMRVKGVEKGAILFGYLAAVGVLALFVAIAVRGGGWPDYLIASVLGILPLALVNVGSRVNCLILYSDRLVVIQPYGLWLKRVVAIPHHAKLSFKGRSESILELTVDQEEPEFNLTIERRRFLFSRVRRYKLSVNRSQGSWLVEGLEYWRDHAGKAVAAEAAADNAD